MYAPVGTILFVGCSIGKISIDKVVKPLLPMFLALFVVMAMICYFPQLSLLLPHAVCSFLKTLTGLRYSDPYSDALRRWIHQHLPNRAAVSHFQRLAVEIEREVRP